MRKFNLKENAAKRMRNPEQQETEAPRAEMPAEHPVQIRLMRKRQIKIRRKPARLARMQRMRLRQAQIRRELARLARMQRMRLWQAQIRRK